MNYRRIFSEGGTYFFTLVTHQRQPIFSEITAITLLRESFQYTLKSLPFTVVASVIMPDHLHFIWTLPPEDCNFSTRWRLIKSHFSRYWCKNLPGSEITSRAKKGEREIWQRRFWEHLIRDETDLCRHIDYIHYNPVKHGLVNSPSDWKYSSFTKYVKQGYYPTNWGENKVIWEGETWME